MTPDIIFSEPCLIQDGVTFGPRDKPRIPDTIVTERCAIPGEGGVNSRYKDAGNPFIFRSSHMIVTYSDGEMCYSRGRRGELQVPVAGLPFIYRSSP
ncbi:MAG: hypothetical protein ACK56F_14070 [bacterium]